MYKIVNLKNGKVYVGSAENLRTRWTHHLSSLRNKKHTKYIQNAFNKHGERFFLFIIIEFVEDKNELIPREQIWLDYYESYLPKNGYNICRFAWSPLGTKLSDKRKRQISLAVKGINHPMFGKKHTDKSKQQMSASKKGMIGTWVGRKHSKKTRERMSLDRRGEGNNRWGKHHSKEAKERIIASNKKKWLDPEYKKMRVDKMRERWLDPEYKKMMLDKRKPKQLLVV